MGPGRHHSLGPFLQHRRSGRLALPTCAHPGDAALWRHPPCQHRLLSSRPGVCGSTRGHGHGRRIALGDRVATEGQAGGVKRMAALGQAFLDPHGSRQCPQPQVTAGRLDRIERPAQCAAMAPLRLDPVTPQQVERFVSTKPGGAESEGEEQPPSHGASSRRRLPPG